MVFLLVFTVTTVRDILFLIYHACAAFFILVYLLPAFILSLRNRESGYERGWVEVFYITYQVLWSWGMLFLLLQAIIHSLIPSLFDLAWVLARP
jgi:hypothetical protein